jgi:hypothetical protein
MIDRGFLKLLRETFINYEALLQNIDTAKNTKDPTQEQLAALADAQLSADRVEQVLMEMITLDPIAGGYKP